MSDNYNLKIGNNFKVMRESIGFTKRQIAGYLGITVRRLEAFENDVLLSADVLEKAFILFGCTLSELETGKSRSTFWKFDGVEVSEFSQEVLGAIAAVNQLVLNMKKMKESQKKATGVLT